MGIELWIALIASSIALLATPGPVVMMLFCYTATYGRSFARVAFQPQFLTPTKPALPQMAISTLDWVYLVDTIVRRLKDTIRPHNLYCIGAVFLIGAATITGLAH